MTLILDAGPMVALADRADPLQRDVEELLRAEPGRLILPAPVSAEVDYLIGARVGGVSRRRFLDDLAAGRFQVECLEAGDYQVVANLDRRYEALAPGLADLSVVVLARRFGTRRVVTFDQVHFRSISPLQGGSFTLLPFDLPRR